MSFVAMRERILLYTESCEADGQGGIAISGISNKEIWASVSEYKHTKEEISGAHNNKKEVSIIIRKDPNNVLKIGTIMQHKGIDYRAMEIQDHKAKGAPDSLMIYWKIHGVEV